MARDGRRRAPRSRVPEARAANPIWKSCDCRLRGPDRRCHRPVTVPAVARGEAHRYTSRELTETREVDLMIHHQDRKSLVSGKSVSVRVDLAGRRLIKHTTN